MEFGKMFVAFLVASLFWKLELSTGCPNKCRCFRSGLKAGEVFCRRLSVFPAMGEFPGNTTRLDIMDSSFSEVPTEHLYKLKELRTLSVTHSSLKSIETFTNSGDSKLTTVLLNDNEISNIEDGAFDDLKELVQINLDNNRLETFPVFRKPLPLKRLYLNGNSIKSLLRSSLQNLAKLNSLELENAQLTELPANIFDKSKDLWHLNLKYSTLETIDDNAFTDSNLQELFLDETKITAIPARGLEKLKLLSLKNVKNFWAIPAGLRRIRKVYVSKYNSFLCCAFVLKKYQRDFARQRQSEGVVTSSYAPSVSSKSTVTRPENVVTSSHAPSASPRSTITRPSKTPSTSSSATTFVYSPTYNGTASTTPACIGFCRRKRRDESGSETTGMPTNGRVPLGSNGTGLSPTSGHSGGLAALPGFVADPVTSPGTQVSGNGGGSFTGLPDGFLTGPVTVPRTHHHVNQTNDSLVTETPFEDVICLPEPDAYHPCEDIMGAKWLTVVSLMVGSVALVANLVVVVVVLSSERRFNVNRFLMSNLALADFFLGLYLFIVVCVSLDTSGEYYNHVRSWQHGAGCQIAGFLAVFSTELSVYTLTVITIERFLAIVYAMQVNTRLSFRAAARAMMTGWMLAVFLALLPLIGVNSYRDVAICLPFNADTSGSLAYVVTILVLNFVAFVVIAVLYGKMFRVVMDTGPTEGGPQRNDAKVAKRMSLLVFTDFVCWLPIAFFGLVAAFGRPLIGVEDSKFLLVFFFPLNSFCNPFLYAFFTKAFKREFFSLLSRFGFCHTRALHHKGTLISLIYSRSRTKRSTVVEDDRDTKPKRVSQVSATGLKLGNSFLNVTGDRYPSPKHENIPMTGLSNLAYTVESPLTASNDRVFFETAAIDGESPKSPARASHSGLASLGPSQLPRAISTSSINGIDGPAVEKRAKKPSVSFGDEPRLRRD